MTIRTTRLKAPQTPRIRTMDLTPQLNGSRQTFTLPRRIQTWDTHYLVWNSTVYRNDVNHRFYTIGNDGKTLTTYFDQAPQGGAGRTLQLAYSSGGDGDDNIYTKEDVDNLINTEAEERKAVDAELNNRINQETAERIAADEVEASAREAKDNELESKIDDETRNRIQGDNELQGQLDAMAAASDVVDIVNTKAELDSYNKKDLTDKDVIKVLNDESNNGATTYYRYNKSSDSFEPIGSVGPYYTKAETDEMLNNVSIPTLDSYKEDPEDNEVYNADYINSVAIKDNRRNVFLGYQMGSESYNGVMNPGHSVLIGDINLQGEVKPGSSVIIGGRLGVVPHSDPTHGNFYDTVSINGEIFTDFQNSDMYDMFNNIAINGRIENGRECMAIGGSVSYDHGQDGSSNTHASSSLCIATENMARAIGSNALSINGEAYSNSIAIGISSRAGHEGIGNETGDYGWPLAPIAIGNDSWADYNNVAIGEHAWTINGVKNSVALGTGSHAYKDNSVDVGYGYPNRYDKAVAETRYITSVKAGVDDTDAVNVKQMKDYVAEHAGGSSGVEINSIGAGLSLSSNGTLSNSRQGVGTYTISSSSNSDLLRITQNGSDLKLLYRRMKPLSGTTSTMTEDVTIDIPEVNDTVNGVMSVEDKAKLDSIDVSKMITTDNISDYTGGSDVNLGKYAISGPQTDTLLYPIVDTDDIVLRGNVAETDTPGSGADVPFCTLPAATTSGAGLMTSTDKTKLDSMLTIKSVDESLALDSNGKLSVVDSGTDLNLAKYVISGPQRDYLLYTVLTEDTIVLRGNIMETDEPESGASVAFCTLPAATTLKAGLMTKDDRIKLDSITTPSLKTYKEGYADLDADSGNLQLLNYIPDNAKYVEINIFSTTNGDGVDASSNKDVKLMNGLTAVAQIPLNLLMGAPGDVISYVNNLTIKLNKKQDSSNSSTAKVGLAKLDANVVGGVAVSSPTTITGVSVDGITGVEIPYTAGHVYYEIKAVVGE